MSITVTLEPGESKEIVFTYIPTEIGIYQVKIGTLIGGFEAIVGGGGTGNLFGRVTDNDTGKGISGISVDADGIIVFTNLEGYYSFVNLDAGTYYMDFTDPKGLYHMKEVDGVVIGSGEKEVNVQMEATGISPIDIEPFRGKYYSPWKGTAHDTIKDLVYNGGCPWTGNPSSDIIRTFCPYGDGEEFWVVAYPQAKMQLKYDKVAEILEHINNAHRLICTETGENFTFSAKATERYDLFVGECPQVHEPMVVEVLPLAPFKTNYIPDKHLAEYGPRVYTDTYEEWFNESYWGDSGTNQRAKEAADPENIRRAAQTYPYLFLATQIMEGPMFARRGWYEEGSEGANYSWCRPAYNSYDYNHPASIPTGISLVIPKLEGKNWKCTVDDNALDQWKTIASFEGTGSVIRWAGDNQGDVHYGKVMNIMIEFGSEVLVILHAYVTSAANLPHDLSTLHRHYDMAKDQLYHCSEALLMYYERFHNKLRTYAVSEAIQSYVSEGGQCVLNRESGETKISYVGMYFYCNWRPYEVNSAVTRIGRELDENYIADKAEIEALIVRYGDNSGGTYASTPTPIVYSQ